MHFVYHFEDGGILLDIVPRSCHKITSSYDGSFPSSDEIIDMVGYTEGRIGVDIRAGCC